MSKNRRRAQRTKTISPRMLHEAAWRWEVEPEPILPAAPRRPFIEDWQTAWAETTLKVVEYVSTQRGWRFYPHDPYRRDDLSDWLLVRAQEIANRYEPRWDAHDPESMWAAYLVTSLESNSRWHYATTLGGPNNDENRAMAQRLHDIAFRAASDEGMDDDGDRVHGPRAQRLEGALVPLVGWRPVDPERWVVLLETFEEHIDDPVVSDSGGCEEYGCDRKHYARGMCENHYKVWKRRATRSGDGALPPAPAREPAAKTPCSVPDCDSDARAKGLCNRHYLQDYRAGKAAS